MINRRRLRRMLAPTQGLRMPTFLAAVGILLFLIGLGLSFSHQIIPLADNLGRRWDQIMLRIASRDSVDEVDHLLGGAMLLLGFYLAFIGIRTLVWRWTGVLNPTVKSNQVVNTFIRRQRLSNGPRIVALGGGTGLSTLLRGLKQHTSNITAVVTVTDDGGSSGRLVQETGIIPPGDIRNCLVGLADAERLMTDLFQHRFRTGRGLVGHSLGNLIILGLIELGDGDYEKALTMASEVLNIRGRVLPSTIDHIILKAIMEDGSEIVGETKIVESGQRIRRLFLEPTACEAFPEALQAIEEADAIIIGPGSVYTSVIPNLLVPGIAEAIAKSDAVKVYVCNVMTQAGESDQFTAAEHVAAIQTNVDPRVHDYVMVNTTRPTETLEDRYRESGQYFVEADTDRIKAMGYKTVVGNFMNETDVVRHDPLKIAARIIELINQ